MRLSKGVSAYTFSPSQAPNTTHLLSLRHPKASVFRRLATPKPPSDAQSSAGNRLSPDWGLNLLVDAAGQEAAVDDQALSGDEGSGIGGKIECGSDHLFGLAETAHGRAHQQFFSARRVIEQIGIESRAEDARSDGVDRNSLLRPLHRERTGQRGNTRLAGGVGGHLG